MPRLQAWCFDTQARCSKHVNERVMSSTHAKQVIALVVQGCAVIWCYAELFGTRNVSKAIFVDQAPLQNRAPDWEHASKGIFDGPSLARIQSALHSDMTAFAAGAYKLDESQHTR